MSFDKKSFRSSFSFDIFLESTQLEIPSKTILIVAFKTSFTEYPPDLRGSC